MRTEYLCTQPTLHPFDNTMTQKDYCISELLHAMCLSGSDGAAYRPISLACAGYMFSSCSSPAQRRELFLSSFPLALPLDRRVINYAFTECTAVSTGCSHSITSPHSSPAPNLSQYNTVTNTQSEWRSVCSSHAQMDLMFQQAHRMEDECSDCDNRSTSSIHSHTLSRLAHLYSLSLSPPSSRSLAR